MGFYPIRESPAAEYTSDAMAKRAPALNQARVSELQTPPLEAFEKLARLNLPEEDGIPLESEAYYTLPWMLRLYDAEGNLVLISEEREAIARQRAEAAEQRIAELESELKRLRGG
jgi:hypothetical protein